MDEYHLTGISLDAFVRWEHRAPSSTDGRGEARADARPRPEQTKANDPQSVEGLVSPDREEGGVGVDETPPSLFLLLHVCVSSPG